MGFKVPKTFKWIYAANFILFFSGLALGVYAAITTGVIIFVILSASMEVLEAIHEMKNEP